METTFYIVRHGETLFNILKRYQGWCDSPLTEYGIEMARKLHDGLQDVDFKLAASSTSERAIDTLDNIIQDRQIPKMHHKGFKEQYFGKLEGAMIDFVKPPKEIQDEGYEFYGGEKRVETVKRFFDAMKEIAVDGNVLIVSHGAAIYCLLRELKPELKAARVRDTVPNCSVAKVSYKDGTFTLKEMPSLEYLK